MNQVVVYEFLLEAVTPLYFGDGEIGLLSDTRFRTPNLFGNAIGGALRDYLRRTDMDQGLIEAFMGDEVIETEVQDSITVDRRKFIPSLLYISDGRIRSPGLLKREGTAVDPRRGTADQHKKYKFFFLPEGTLIRFSIECDEWVKDGKREIRLTPEDLELLIGTWAHGFDSGKLLLGGHKNNGFGKVRLVRLKCRQFKFERAEDLDRYLFCPHAESLQKVDWTKLRHLEPREDHRVVFTMKGRFPYGVYQHYERKEDMVSNDKTVSGLQSRKRNRKDAKSSCYLPASSVKGVVKHEIRQLLQRIHQDDRKVAEDLEELFGGLNKKGKLRFEELWFEHFRDVQIDRPNKKENEKDNGTLGWPVYVKIDRLTGGAYDAALKTQREIQGEATIRVELKADTEEEVQSFRFPIIYALRRIGTGRTPLGGRTVIGLGQFFAETLQIGDQELPLSKDQLSPSELESLKQDYEKFIGWCKRERN